MDNTNILYGKKCCTFYFHSPIASIFPEFRKYQYYKTRCQNPHAAPCINTTV